MDCPKHDTVKVAHDLAMLFIKRQLDEGSIKGDQVTLVEEYRKSYDNFFDYLTNAT